MPRIAAPDPWTPRVRCYTCYRPADQCFCHRIPRIANRTEILILQHPHERFHAFNTARIVAAALVRSRLIVDYGHRLDQQDLPIRPGAALLYPAAEATDLKTLDPSSAPSQIVLLDGTWRQARALVRDVAVLGSLPRVSIDPERPSRYRIRKEPDDQFLSTVEATAAVLRTLEPETPGIEDLIGAFDAMVDQQIAHEKPPSARRSKRPRNREDRRIPRALRGEADRIVVAYGESAFGGSRVPRRQRTPLFWVAQRLGSGETFLHRVRNPTPLSDNHLAHLEMSRSDFDEATDLTAFTAAWTRFLRPDDVLVVFNKSAQTLLENVGAPFAHCLVLHGIFCDLGLRQAYMEDLLEHLGLSPGPVRLPGRAGRRLAHAMVAVEYLRDRAGPLETPAP